MYPETRPEDLVVDRLRGRLVERRSSELVAALERRHGQNWPRHVLEGAGVGGTGDYCFVSV